MRNLSREILALATETPTRIAYGVMATSTTVYLEGSPRGSAEWPDRVVMTQQQLRPAAPATVGPAGKNVVVVAVAMQRSHTEAETDECLFQHRDDQPV